MNKGFIRKNFHIEQNILNSLEACDMDRKELTEETHYPRTSVYEALIRLENKGLITHYSSKGRVGRPTIYWKKVEITHEI